LVDPALLRAFVLGWLAIAAVTFVVLLRIDAPYGRHARSGWGPQLPRRLGWILMEAPSAIGFALVYLVAPRPPSAPALAMLALWEAHYLHRAFIYPFRLRGGQQRMPCVIALFGASFNAVNAAINSIWIIDIGHYPVAWLADPRFLVGLALFAAGFAANRHADSILLSLRREADGYRIPRGGLYRFVSCPNYLGEIVEWCGWALLTWSLPGAVFAAWTAANLIPRALSNHRWYRARFPDYPPERKALVPLVY
jgi:protein-S-isoprenylcysteine O-methyltransferase Ste14